MGRTQVPEIRVSMARARAARVSAAGTCSCSARQRPAHPNGPALSELSTVAWTQALERKKPVISCDTCDTLPVPSTPSTLATPQIRQRPHANCASHACPFRSKSRVKGAKVHFAFWCGAGVCKCRSMSTPLPVDAATRVDAVSSVSAVSMYSCSTRHTSTRGTV